MIIDRYLYLYIHVINYNNMIQNVVDCLLDDCQCEEDTSALEEMKQVVDEAEKALHTVLTASSFKGNSRECSGNAPEGHGAAVLTHTSTQINSFSHCKGSLNTTHTSVKFRLHKWDKYR